MATIDRFTGDYFFLSNFYKAKTCYQGIVYPTSEHAFQAAKTLDPFGRRWIAAQGSPSMAKKLGRATILRPNWDDIKIAVMLEVLIGKFNGHQNLADALVATGDAELVEGNDWGDRFWGTSGGSGRNVLGKLLMYLRDEYVADEFADDEG